MKRRLAETGIICVVVMLVVGSANVQAQVAKNVAQKSPWGPADEIGTLNMMIDTSRLDVLKQVASGKVYDLGVDLFVGMPNCCGSFGDPTFQIWMTHTPAWASPEIPDLNQGRLRGHAERRLELIGRPVTNARM